MSEIIYENLQLLPVKESIRCNGKLIDLSKPAVMGILNVTPDSFYDGGKYEDLDTQLLQVERMLKEGAMFIDIGGSSTKPGALPISEDEELSRTLPIIDAVLKNFPDALISIDTFHARVAKEAIHAGACIINDISGGTDDEEMIRTATALQVPFICMHKKGKPADMQVNPQYENVTKELLQFFAHRIEDLRKEGLQDIIIDPGFGFGKNLSHNYELLKNLHLFRMLECPIIVGISRKSMINKILHTKPENALIGTTVANTIAILQGANILRVHDVKEAVQLIKIVNYYREIV